MNPSDGHDTEDARRKLIERAAEIASEDRLLEAASRMDAEPMVDYVEDGTFKVTIAEELTQSVPSDFAFTTPASDEPDVPRSAPGPMSFRPKMRRPLAILRVFDDDQQGYEEIRIRKDQFTIGRRNCDLTIPFDMGISREHAVIEYRLSSEGSHKWTLRDSSRYGTFVRVDQAKLAIGKQILIGARRYSFEEAADGFVLRDTTTKRTQNVLPLESDENWIGRDPALCPEFMQNDMMLDYKHAMIYQRQRGEFWIKDLVSTNGVYVRIVECSLPEKALFQLGEQRFGFFVC